MEKIFKITIAVLSCVIVGILVYVFIIDKSSGSSIIEESGSINNVSDNSGEVDQYVSNYISALNSKSNNLDDYFMPEVDYYTGGKMSASSVIQDKRKMFEKWQNINLTISNLNSIKTEDGYECIYDKEFKFTNNDGSFYKGKVKSVLLLTQDNQSGGYKILKESDDKIYFTEKSQSFKEFISEFITNVPKSKSYFLEHSESSIISNVLMEDSYESSSEIYSQINNLVKSKYKINGNNVTFSTYTTEFDENGTELPHEFCFKKDNSGKWKLYKINWAGC